MLALCIYFQQSLLDSITNKKNKMTSLIIVWLITGASLFYRVFGFKAIQ